MQFNMVALSVAALVATAAAQNATNGYVFELVFWISFLTLTSLYSTNGTNPGHPTGVPEGSAFNNAVSGGLLGAVVAAGIALVGTPSSLF